MIKVLVKEMAELKGHTRSSLSKGADITYPTVLLFWNEHVKKIDTITLDRLCEFLECEPGDLIKRIPNSDQPDSKS